MGKMTFRHYIFIMSSTGAHKVQKLLCCCSCDTSSDKQIWEICKIWEIHFVCIENRFKTPAHLSMCIFLNSEQIMLDTFQSSFDNKVK